MNKFTLKIKVPIDKIKESSWSTILIFSILYCIYVSFVNFVVFKFSLLQLIYKSTFGLIDATLIVNLFSILVFIFIIILKYGKLNFFDIGLKKNKLLTAIITIITLWIFIQLFNAITNIITSGKLIINSDWNKYGASSVFGNFISQVFGNCLFEELAFRGFLLVQICKKFNNKKSNLFICMIGSQLIFSLIHIPSRIVSGMDSINILVSLILVLIIGILFSVTYLVTDNIFLVIGLHALWNAPLLIFNGPSSIIVILIFILLLLLIENRNFARFKLKKSKENNNYSN